MAEHYREEEEKVAHYRPRTTPAGPGRLWKHWQWPETGEPVESYTIITTNANANANDFMAPIHVRMPVILGERDGETWLDPETDNPLLLQSILVPCPDDWLN